LAVSKTLTRRSISEFIAKIGEAFEHGGIWMWPIALFQAFSFAIMVERFFALYVFRGLNSEKTALAVEENIRRGELNAVVKKTTHAAKPSAIARAILAGTQAAMRFGGRDEIQAKMDEVLLRENALLDSRIGFLSMLGNVATLTGLLGTISGMIRSFAAVAYANPAEKASLLAKGISEAMNCTAYGLIVAIPALILFGILQDRSNKIADDLNHSALKVFNWLSFSFEAAPAHKTVNELNSARREHTL
jgi:biopolymer transport protein ExbB/TolQ